MARGQRILEAQDVHFAFNKQAVLFAVRLNITQGEFVGIIGPNGAGKSTLLKVLIGLHRPVRGQVTLMGRDINDYSAKELARMRAYVPQTPEIPLLYNVQQIVRMGRYPYQSAFGVSDAAGEHVVTQALKQLELSGLKQRLFSQLSGGEQQRALLASALAQQSPLLFLDEPTSALDLKHQQSIFRHLRRLVLEEGKTIVTVTHDVNLAAQFCDRLILLNRGRVVAEGAPADVLKFRLLQQVYGVKVYIDINPFTGSIYILPYELEK